MAPTKAYYKTCEICGVRAYRNNNEKRQFLAKFPLDEDRCRQWVKAVGKEDLVYVPIEKLHTLKHVCGNHFKSKDFKKKRTQLKKNAIPTLNLKACLPDEMLLEFPCHIHSTNSFSQEISDTTASQSQIKAIAGPSKSVLLNKSVHKFPNPKKYPDLFADWVAAVGDKLEEKDSVKIYKNKKICDHHFLDSHKISKNRLAPGAVPVYFNRVRPSLATFVETDHNYSYSVRDTGKPTPEGYAGEDEEVHLSETLPYASSKPENSQIDTPGTDLTAHEPSTLDLLDTFDTHDDDVSVDPSHVRGDPAGKAIFSWQKTELIEADDPEECAPPPSPSADPTLALTCDLDSTPDQTVPSEPAVEDRHFENRCKDCGETNGGFEFWCVQCVGGALCGACAARPPHHAHYVLRAPMGSAQSRTQAVLAVIRQQLQNENLLSQHETVDDGVKLEVKEEPADDPPGEAAPRAGSAPRAESDPLAVSDPLFCGPHDSHEPQGSHELPAAGAHKCIPEETVSRHEPLELPSSQATDQAKNEIMTVSTQQSVLLVSPAPEQRVFLIQIEKVLPTQPNTVIESANHKENLTGSTEQVRGPLMEAPLKVTSEPQPSETVILDLDDLADETIEYSEERLDSDIETIEDLLDDEELDEDHLVDEDLIEDDPSDQGRIVGSDAGRGVKRKKDAEETSPTKGPYEEMVRALPSKVEVRVQPLSSLEIRNWTADRKRLRRKD